MDNILIKYVVLFITAEALHVAHLMGAHGYIFPIDDHILTVKNDGAYYRFQVGSRSICICAMHCLQSLNFLPNLSTLALSGQIFIAAIDVHNLRPPTCVMNTVYLKNYC